MYKKICKYLFNTRYLLLFELLFGLLVKSNGQPTSRFKTIEGQLLFSSGQPVVMGQILLLRADSNLVKATYTDSTGHFLLMNVVAGKYRIRASYIGALPVDQVIDLPDSVTNFRISITIISSGIKLNEVSVKEKRPAFEIVGDKIILNVESNPVFSGGYAFDALSTAPRVAVDPISKSVSIDGKTGIILYQNNRQLYLPSDQVIAYLQSIPANSIARIEILTNPPAQYDAGSSGVILLFTKEIDSQGFNGEVTLSAGAGRYAKANSSINLFFRTAKVKGALLYTPSFRPTYFSWRSDQYLTDPTSSTIGFAHSDEFNRIDNTSHLFRTNWDWNITKKTTLGAVLQGSHTVSNVNPTSMITYQQAIPVAPITQIDAVTQLRQRINNFTGNLNIRREFKTSQTYLSADVDMTVYTVKGRSSATFVQHLQQPPEYVQILYPNKVLIHTAKIDFSSPINKKGLFETGLKYSAIEMHNLPQTEQYSPYFSSLIPLLEKSYQYQEYTKAAYGNASYAWTKLSILAGLRLERTEYKSVSGKAGTVDRNYTNLFPSLTFQYTGYKKQQYSLAYNRRIVRPSFDLLNPAYIFYDPLTLYSGNPVLLPQLTTTLQATYSTANRISFNLIYSRSQNRIAEVVYRIDSTAATTLDYHINFDWERRIAATLSLPIKIISSWQMQVVGTWSNSKFYSTFKDIPTQSEQSTANIRLNNTLKGKAWSGNLNITYRSKAVVGYMYYDPIWFLDLGIQRSLGERTSVKLSATDVFHTMLINNYGDYLNTNISFRHKYESQRIMVSYSYHFGNSQTKRLKERGFGSEAEQERLGGNR